MKIKDFNHCHIIPVIAVCLDAEMSVIMPYMANGSVLSYLKKEQKTLLLQDEADMEEVKTELWVKRSVLISEVS